jgi:hypothetical protein
MEKIKFKVNPTTSAKEDQAAQVEVLAGLFERIEKSPALNELIPRDKKIEVWNSIVAASGVENPEKLQIDLEEDGNGEQQAPQMTPEQVQAMIEEALTAQGPTDDPLLKIFRDLPETAKQQLLQKYGIQAEDKSVPQQEIDIKKFDTAQKAAGPSDVELDSQMAASLPEDQPIIEDELPEEPVDTTEDDLMAAEELSQRGFDNEQVAMALELTKQDVPIEEILNQIGAPRAAQGVM